ncbi:MAG: hypothetical protein FWG66_13325 [Spirochaetes bacterium]|nr:hypothetical protein [Spirochaetota bacterium]
MKRKKIALVAGFLLASSAFVLTGCGTTETAPARISGFPAPVWHWMADAPEDVAFGIGVARSFNDLQSMMIAASRARVALAGEIGAITQIMIENFDDGYFTTTVMQRVDMTFEAGTVSTALQHMEPDGEVWVIAVIDRAEAAKLINEAVASLEEPGLAYFDAQELIQGAIAERQGQTPAVVSN